MSAAIVKLWALKENKEIVFWGWNYGEMIPACQDYDIVVMCDISFPAEKMDFIRESKESLKDSTKRFIWIDHHISAINDLYQFKIETGTILPDGLRDPEFAACELTWKYFFPEVKMPEIVRLLGRYDCFGHKGTSEEKKVLEFQYGARQFITHYDEAFSYIEHCMTNTEYQFLKNQHDVLSILETGKTIYEYLITKAKQIWRRAYEINLLTSEGVINIACVNEERFNPINFGIDYHAEGYGAVLCYWYESGKWKFSLYNEDGKVDCSIIAKSFGGGGHKGASGFVLDTIEGWTK
jgi:hypothetical protein